MVRVVWIGSEKQELIISQKLESFIFWKNFQALFFSTLGEDLIYSSSEKFVMLFKKVFKKDLIDSKDFSIIERVLSDKKFLQDISKKLSWKDFEDILDVYKNTILWLKFSPFTMEFEAENREIVILKIFQTILEIVKNNIIENTIRISETEVNSIITYWKAKSKVLDPEPNFLSQIELNAILAWSSSIKDKNLNWPKWDCKTFVPPMNYSWVSEDEWAQAIAEIQQDWPDVKIFETPILDEIEKLIDFKRLDEACSWLVNISK